MLKDKLVSQGGPKSINIPVPHYYWPYISEEQNNVILQQLITCLSERNNKGVIGRFEKEFANYIGVKYAIALSSATGAIHTMSIAAGLKPGDDILCPVYTFHATMSPFAFEGIKTILCDCDKKTGCISIESIKNRITKETKALMITHIWGISCDMDEITNFCKEHGLLLFEDCAHAQFATWKGKRVGTFGDMAAFSLNHKALTGGEGGVLVTNCEEYRDKVLLTGLYNNRCKEEISSQREYYKYALTGFGLKYRAHPLAIALALNQLQKSDEIEKRRRKNLEIILEGFQGQNTFVPINTNKENLHGLYLFAFRYARIVPNFDKYAVEKLFEDEGAFEIAIPGSTFPLNNEPLFSKTTSEFNDFTEDKKINADQYFPNAYQFFCDVFKCPLWGYEGDEEIVLAYSKTIHKIGKALDNIYLNS